MLLFSRSQYSTTGIGCVYLAFSVLIGYVEDGIQQCQIVIKKFLVHYIGDTLYHFVRPFSLGSCVHVLCLPVWGIFSHDLSFTIYTWSNLAHFFCCLLCDWLLVLCLLSRGTIAYDVKWYGNFCYRCRFGTPGRLDHTVQP